MPDYEITTTPDHTHPILRPTPLTRPPMRPEEIPPGVALVTLPSGHTVLAYTHPQPATPTSPAPGPQPMAQPIPTWAKTTALLTPTVGVGTAAAGIGLSYAAPGLIAMSQALWSAVALIAASGAALLTLRLTSRNRDSGKTAVAPTHITQNIHAGGLFGRANGTINHH